MLKFLTLFKLSSLIQILNLFSHNIHWEKDTWDFTLDHPISRCWTCFFYLPVLNPTDENHPEGPVYVSKHNSTCVDALAQSKVKSPWIILCYELLSWVRVENRNLVELYIYIRTKDCSEQVKFSRWRPSFKLIVHLFRTVHRQTLVLMLPGPTWSLGINSDFSEMHCIPALCWQGLFTWVQVGRPRLTIVSRVCWHHFDTCRQGLTDVNPCHRLCRQGHGMQWWTRLNSMQK
jgi:hypothetical protein